MREEGEEGLSPAGREAGMTATATGGVFSDQWVSSVVVAGAAVLVAGVPALVVGVGVRVTELSRGVVSSVGASALTTSAAGGNEGAADPKVCGGGWEDDGSGRSSRLGTSQHGQTQLRELHMHVNVSWEESKMQRDTDDCANRFLSFVCVSMDPTPTAACPLSGKNPCSPIIARQES